MRYRILFNSVSDAIYACPLNADETWGQVKEVNNVLCQRLGYGREELLQLPVNNILTLSVETNPLITEKLPGGGARDI